MNTEKKDIFSPYGQYHRDLFRKLGFDFVPGKKILDIGCGDGSDARIFIEALKLNVFGIDIYKHENIDKIEGLSFQQAGIYNIPFESDIFDYVFLHDVLHHIDEEHQSQDRHRTALLEIERVTRSGGIIIVVEGNRYNPLFYPHMVKMLGHDHWKQSYFIKVIRQTFQNVEFKYFEAHAYPWALTFWKFYEYCMEKYVPKRFLAYNVAIITKC